jgi:hypothetical protein
LSTERGGQRWWEVSAEEAASNGVDEEAAIGARGLVKQDPVERTEPRLVRTAWVGGDGAPVAADTPQVHVVVEVVVGQQAVGDAVDEI